MRGHWEAVKVEVWRRSHHMSCEDLRRKLIEPNGLPAVAVTGSPARLQSAVRHRFFNLIRPAGRQRQTMPVRVGIGCEGEILIARFLSS